MKWWSPLPPFVRYCFWRCCFPVHISSGAAVPLSIGVVLLSFVCVIFQNQFKLIDLHVPRLNTSKNITAKHIKTKSSGGPFSLLLGWRWILLLGCVALLFF